MTYKIVLDKKVQKYLNKQTDKIVRRFFDKVELLSQDPYTPFLDIKKFEGMDSSYRLRIGKVRYLYTIHYDEVYIYFFDADGRGDIYKK